MTEESYNISENELLSNLGAYTSDMLADNASYPDYLIDGLIERETIGLCYGKSGVKKTFLMLELAHCVATGRSFFGKRVKQAGKVLYIAGEGKHGLGRRLKALSLKHGPTEKIFVIPNSEVMNNAYAEKIALLVQKADIRLIIYDTFNQLFPHVNNNDSGETSKAIHLIRKISELGGCTSIIIHHTGKNASKSAEGSHTFESNVDFRLRLERSSDYIQVLNDKQKDGELAKPFIFDVEPIKLGIYDDNQKESTSLVVCRPNESLSLAMRTKLPEEMKGTNQDKLLAVITSLYLEQVNTSGSEDVVVEIRDVRELMAIHNLNYHPQTMKRLLDDRRVEKVGSGYKPSNF
ncbi:MULTISPECIES: AAA family ATPase [Vibrio]|uniref:AAA family ATPase n=1 Tax=Vibrio TaxID=662 RepID=UPI0020766204|nr:MULTISPECIES: AAA family ATPase [Vibrio]USD32049.1 AAA family ATPase [Vibrio sp. SCSIO 43186]USD45090.1 AAA family ATPase [Vibrio sp. SCSIO 43145]USD69172.1 AAA family ATPase [Vibrio sp. SCSIO 43139]USD96864.1 hypothetical protein CTT30_12605 [Vibrio coralliilyticus]